MRERSCLPEFGHSPPPATTSTTARTRCLAGGELLGFKWKRRRDAKMQMSKENVKQKCASEQKRVDASKRVLIKCEAKFPTAFVVVDAPQNLAISDDTRAICSRLCGRCNGRARRQRPRSCRQRPSLAHCARDCFRHHLRVQAENMIASVAPLYACFESRFIDFVQANAAVEFFRV